jgi:hypothetical protein
MNKKRIFKDRLSFERYEHWMGELQAELGYVAFQVLRDPSFMKFLPKEDRIEILRVVKVKLKRMSDKKLQQAYRLLQKVLES